MSTHRRDGRRGSCPFSPSYVGRCVASECVNDSLTKWTECAEVRRVTPHVFRPIVMVAELDALVDHLFDLQIEEVALHVFDVRRCRRFDGPSAGVGNSHHQAAAVLGAFLAGDQIPFLHPGEVMRQAAAVPADLGAELTGPE